MQLLRGHAEMSRDSISEVKRLPSQNSFELDATKLLELITADDNVNSSTGEVKISRHALGKVSKDLNLTEEELDIIFSALDDDQDGYITSTELRNKVLAKNTLVFEKCPEELWNLGQDLSILNEDWLVYYHFSYDLG